MLTKGKETRNPSFRKITNSNYICVNQKELIFFFDSAMICQIIIFICFMICKSLSCIQYLVLVFILLRTRIISENDKCWKGYYDLLIGGTHYHILMGPWFLIAICPEKPIDTNFRLYLSQKKLRWPFENSKKVPIWDS